MGLRSKAAAAAAAAAGASSRDSSPSLSRSSSSSSLSDDAGCGDVALTATSCATVRATSSTAAPGGLAPAAAVAAQGSGAAGQAGASADAEASGAAHGAVDADDSVGGGEGAAAASGAVARAMLEAHDTGMFSPAVSSRASEPGSGQLGSAVLRDRILSPSASAPLDGSPLLSPRLPEVALPEMMDESFLLSLECRSAICGSLPAIACGREWVLLYSTIRHGISLQTLYRRSSSLPGPCLLAVTDHEGVVFGAFASTALVPANRRKYQGSNDVFVFTDVGGEPVIYRSTGANRYFILCLNEALSFGGGGHFALCLQEDLLSGSSGSCETFNSPCLTKSEDFRIKHVELWGFAHQSRYAPAKANWQEPSKEPGFHAW